MPLTQQRNVYQVHSVFLKISRLKLLNSAIDAPGFGAGCELTARGSTEIEPVPARHEKTPRQQIADGNP